MPQDDQSLVGRLDRLRGEHEHVRLRRRVRILEVSTLVAEMPEIGISRIDLLLRRSDRDAARSGIVDGVLAAANVPLAPRRDHRKVGREGGERQLEPHLVIPLAGAAVCQRVRTDAARDLHLPLRDERSSHRRAQQVLAVVHSAGAQRREDEVANELLAEVLDVALLGSRGDRLVADAAQLFTVLSDVGRDADDARVVVLAKPGNDDRRVETTGVREDDGARHGCS